MSNLYENKKRVVYLAGPFTGDTAEHRRQARLAASDLRAKGFNVIVPHLESEGCEACMTESQWVQHGLMLLKVCDFIAVFGNWSASQGTLIELNNAADWGIPLVAVYNSGGIPLFLYNGNEIDGSEYKPKSERLSDAELKELFGKKRVENPTYKRDLIAGFKTSREIFEHQIPEHLRGTAKDEPVEKPYKNSDFAPADYVESNDRTADDEETLWGESIEKRR